MRFRLELGGEGIEGIDFIEHTEDSGGAGAEYGFWSAEVL
jgi:hypothetical protein